MITRALKPPPVVPWTILWGSKRGAESRRCVQMTWIFLREANPKGAKVCGKFFRGFLQLCCKLVVLCLLLGTMLLNGRLFQNTEELELVP